MSSPISVAIASPENTHYDSITDKPTNDLSTQSYSNGLISAAIDTEDSYTDSNPRQPLLGDDISSDIEITISHNATDSSRNSPDIFIKRSGETVIGEETSLRIAVQVFFPYIVAGLGMVGAGAVLEIVKNWKVFVDVSEVFILVPALLGLKGNLEMTLASRLSTQANLGHMDTAKEQWKMISGNMALIQAQALVVGLLASMFAIVLGWVPEGKFSLTHGLLLCASSVLTAGIASFILGSIMVGVVVLSRRFHINPDNVATPIAASLGDLTTISLLAAISRALYSLVDEECEACPHHVWVSPLLLCLALSLIPVWWYIAHHNKYSHGVLYSGWTPVIGAMVISSLGGLVLDYTVVKYDEVAVFQPVINGVGGNLVAVQASRLSTALHKASTPGVLPENAVHGCPSPLTTFFGKNAGARTARVLMLMVLPGQLLFILLIYAIQPSADSINITPVFTGVYLAAALLQVLLLLFIANWLVHLLWKRGTDPDNAAIPYLTAIGDFLGTVLLALAFLALSFITPANPPMNVGVTVPVAIQVAQMP